MGAKAVFAASPAIIPSSDTIAPAWYTFASTLVIDLLALSVVYWLAVIGRHLVTPGSYLFYFELFPGLALFVAAFCIQGLYPGLLLHPAEEMRRVFHCVSIVFLLVLCTTFLWHNAQWYSRSIFLIVWALGAPAILIARFLGRRILSQRNWWGVPAVVFGSGPAAQRIVEALGDRKLGVRVTNVWSDPAALSSDLGTSESLPPSSHSRARIAGKGTHYAIVVMPHQVPGELRDILQHQCNGFRHVLIIPDIPGLCSLGVSAREIGDDIGFEVPQRLFHTSASLVKRALDLVSSTLALLILAPLLLLISLAIKLSSPGPALFGHERYGRDGKPFRALKFRTMAKNGDEILMEYFRYHPEEQAAWRRDQKLKHDPRVTMVGRWLRRYSLDELPQLFNVLTGHMSLVGPRPIVEAEIGKYGRGYGLYTRVLPGISGLWQVSGRNDTSYEERVMLDEYYVRNWSIWLDAYILVRTVKAVLKAEGAY